jgi:hypothetical protein
MREKDKMQVFNKNTKRKTIKNKYFILKEKSRKE